LLSVSDAPDAIDVMPSESNSSSALPPLPRTLLKPNAVASPPPIENRAGQRGRRRAGDVQHRLVAVEIVAGHRDAAGIVE